VRFWFGGDVADGPPDSRGSSVVSGPPGVAGATAWTTRTGQTQVTDLLPYAGDPPPIVFDGNGVLRPFQGPDGTDTMWLYFGSGARVQLRGRGRVVLPPAPTDLPSALALLNVLRAGLIRAGLATDN